MLDVSVKICGLTSKEAVNAAVNAGVDYVGFVFFPASPRDVSAKKAAELATLLPSTVKTVAVTVDASDSDLDEILKDFTPDFLQLHGHETLERVKEVQEKYAPKVIKAISIRESDDVAAGAQYAQYADMLLFDAKAPLSSVLPGGNGLSFDWTLLKDRDFSVPWMLSGGLNRENVREAISVTHATMVDVSSAVERAPGVKDEGLMQAFVAEAKNK